MGLIMPKPVVLAKSLTCKCGHSALNHAIFPKERCTVGDCTCDKIRRDDSNKQAAGQSITPPMTVTDFSDGADY